MADERFLQDVELTTTPPTVERTLVDPTTQPGGGGATNLVIQDALHTLASDELALTQVHQLVIQDALHALTSDDASYHKDDDFNHALSGYDATAGTPTIVSSPVRSGSGALEINPAGSGESVTYNVPAGIRRLAKSFYIRFGVLPTANAFLASVANASSVPRLTFDITSGKFAVKQGGNPAVTGGPILVAGTWYLVDFEVNTSASPMVLKAKIDGGTEFTTGFAATPNDITAVTLGSGPSDSFTAYYEDWLVSLRSDAYPIGPHGNPGIDLVVADATHGHTADNLVLEEVGGEVTLVVADATHGHSADNIELTQEHVLVIAEAAHALASDNIDLTQVHVLAIQEALHALASDNIELTQEHVLAIQDALHDHAADNVTLTVEGATDLVIQDALHGHAADSPSLTQVHTLVVADALHGHAADNLVLTQVHSLVVQDALHGLTSEVPHLVDPDADEPDTQDVIRMRRRRAPIGTG